MKCLKNAKTGNIIRVDDKQADQLVGREWKYVSKDEWKKTTRKPEPVVEAVNDQITDAVTISEKKKNTKQDLPDNGNKFVKTRKK